MGYASETEFRETVKYLGKYLNKNNGRLIRQELAGKTCENGVKRDVLGFPIFKESDKAFTATIKKDLYLENYTEQSKECTKQLQNAIKEGNIDKNLFNSKQLKQIQDGEARIKGFIWHHDKVSGKIQLVKGSVHRKVKHTGGRAIWGGGSSHR